MSGEMTDGVGGGSGCESGAASPAITPAGAELAPPTDLWALLRTLTPARIGLGRTGVALPTTEVLRFGLAHARARDAVQAALDVDRLAADLAAAGFASRRVCSAAPDRATYLMRPDLGRRLRPADAEALRASATGDGGVCFVIADGLSATAVQAHAVPLLCELNRLREAALPDARGSAGTSGWRGGPITRYPFVIAEQGRVALGDEIGECLGARTVVVLIGERPGLSSPDSLGIYLTFAPRIGRTDAERNCLSSVRPEGLGYAEAARRLSWLLDAAVRIGATGVALKDRSDEAGEISVRPPGPASLRSPGA